jgi:3-hydroxymyristoyl/3-hydroxydecanoyl-(acyl carrier protein) dehydratase
LDPDFHADLAKTIPTTDVWGSTETGGIATRQGGEATWAPLPGVRVSVSTDSAEVTSPWCAPFRLQDEVELTDAGRLRLLGRRDRVVKVFGKRVDLADLEATLCKFPGVVEATVLVDPSPEGQGRLLAAVAPATVDVAKLRSALLAAHDPVVVPRRIRAMSALPRTAAGKPSRQGILAEFVKRDRRDFPIVRLSGDAGAPQFQIEIPLNSQYFEGHFPGAPLLPAIVQLQEIVLPRARELFPDLGTLQGFLRLKFRKPLLPGSSIFARLERTSRAGGPPSVSFTLTFANEELVCSGLAQFAPTPEDG